MFRNFLLQRYILVREAISEQLEVLDFCRKVVELLNLSPMEGITYDYETSGSSGDQVNDEISMEEAQDFATDTDEFIENVQVNTEFEAPFLFGIFAQFSLSTFGNITKIKYTF